MARTPRASVPKTTGQGISRLSYQKGRRLSGKDDVPSVKSSSGPGQGSSRSYGKFETTTKVDPINVSYGDTIEPTDLKDIEGMFKGGPPKGPKLSHGKERKLK